MAEIKITSYRAERLKEITDSLEKKMGRVGAIVQAQAQRNVHKTGTEHPQVKSGDLINSIKYWKEISASEISVLIGSRITQPPYPSYLEFGTINMPPYPWLFPAVEMSRDKIVETLGSKEFGVERVE